MTTIKDVPREILSVVFDMCGECSFVCCFVCKEWMNVWKTITVPLSSSHIVTYPSRFDKGIVLPLKIVQWMNAFFKIPFTNKTVFMAAKSGDVEFMDWASDNVEYTHDRGEKVYFHAASRGNLNIIKLLVEWGWQFNENLGFTAARCGHIDILEWIFENSDKNFDINHRLCVFAAKGGHIHVLEWLRDHGCKPSMWNIGEFAAANGDIKMMKWALDNSCSFGSIGQMYKIKDVRTLEWAKNHGITINSGIWTHAVKDENFEMLKWLRDNGCRWNPTKNLFNAAVENGHVRVLKWLLDNGYELNYDAIFTLSAFKGHIQILEWLKVMGFPFDGKMCIFPVKKGKLDTLKWLKDYGCRFDERMCARAAKAGDLEMLKWLRDNGYPWDERTCKNALNAKNLKLLKWARKNGCPS